MIRFIQGATLVALAAVGGLFVSNTAVLIKQEWAWNFDEKAGVEPWLRRSGVWHCEFFVPFSVFTKNIKGDACPRTMSVAVPLAGGP